MTGPDHYREAEKILASIPAALDHAARIKANGETTAAGLNVSVAMAQVHATLALAAAIAEPIAKSYDGDDFREYARDAAEAVAR